MERQCLCWLRAFGTRLSCSRTSSREAIRYGQGWRGYDTNDDTKTVASARVVVGTKLGTAETQRDNTAQSQSGNSLDVQPDGQPFRAWPAVSLKLSARIVRTEVSQQTENGWLTRRSRIDRVQRLLVEPLQLGQQLPSWLPLRNAVGRARFASGIDGLLRVSTVLDGATEFLRHVSILTLS
jgi:hypothetical protein